MIFKVVLVVLAAVFGIALMALAFSVPIWLLWNWLMPDVFGLPVVSFWQALGLGLLSGLLFRSGGASVKAKED